MSLAPKNAFSCIFKPNIYRSYRRTFVCQTKIALFAEQQHFKTASVGFNFKQIKIRFFPKKLFPITRTFFYFPVGSYKKMKAMVED
jgi:hypothetical protein